MPVTAKDGDYPMCTECGILAKPWENVLSLGGWIRIWWSNVKVAVTSSCDLWPPKSKQFILESNWMYVPDIMKFPQGMSDISRSLEWYGCEVTVTLTLGPPRNTMPQATVIKVVCQDIFWWRQNSVKLYELHISLWQLDYLSLISLNKMKCASLKSL